jgi:hypothetical protein
MNELPRRQFISELAKTCLGVGLLPLTGNYIHADDLGPSKLMARARSVIYLNMSGAMSHVDTFDPKPGTDQAGPVEAIHTSADDIILSQYLPTIAQHMHNAALVRSVTSNQGAHMQAGYLMHTSYQKRGTISHPTFGSWVAKLKGKLNSTIPGFVKVGGGYGSPGYLESQYGPVPIMNPRAGLANSKKADYLTDDNFDARLNMASILNSEFREKFPIKKVRAYSDLYKDAVRLMNSNDINAFDITQEPEYIHELYGTSNFGQGCLLARRLIENRVRYVEVTRGGWDTHDDNFTRVEANCADIDKAIGALLLDLERRGLLSETLVVLTSEFGRTPDINPRDGRDHWPNAFSAMFAGAGIKGGTVYGSSDEHGKRVAENPQKPEDLNATIARLLGISTLDIHYSPSGRPFKVANEGEPIMDIIL